MDRTREEGGAPKNGERAPGRASTPAFLPGYMRPTMSSAGARAAQVSTSSVSISVTAAPSAVLGSRTPHAGRATCSSVLRSARVAHGGSDGCRYAYCSLKGQALAPLLGAFVAAARIKTQQRMKHRDVSAFRNTNGAGLDGGFLVQVYPGAKTVVSSGSSCSGLSMEYPWRRRWIAQWRARCAFEAAAERLDQ